MQHGTFELLIKFTTDSDDWLQNLTLGQKLQLVSHILKAPEEMNIHGQIVFYSGMCRQPDHNGEGMVPFALETSCAARRGI